MMYNKPLLKPTVIIVDDQALIRDTWSLLLTSGGYDVVGKTGDDITAISEISTKRPHLVLLDITMGPTNGFELLKSIRKFSPGTKVIAVSSHTQPSYAKKMMRGGAKGYVTKNSKSNELLHALKEVISGQTYICKEIKDILTLQAFSVTDSNGIENLSEREIEVIRFLRNGYSSKKIAEAMFVQPRTVEVHRHNILKKLMVKNTAELIQYVNERGL